jgi:aldose 1-epimerase
MNDYTLENANGLRMRVSEIGGAVMELHVPDRFGRFSDIVLGHDSVEAYKTGSSYLGALVGRYGNRIANGTFSLDGNSYCLAKNNGENHLHGGDSGFDRAAWKAESISGDGFSGLILSCLSKDGEEGYPGNLDVRVTYKLTNKNEWILEYEATTDKPTIVNLTQHSYFNLAGHDSGSIVEHELELNADVMTPVNGGLIPTGEMLPVAGTVFDFRSSKAIGKEIATEDVQLERGGGYDHNFVLNKETRGGLELGASVLEPVSGRTMEVLTTEPGVQFYSGNFLDGSIAGKGNTVYGRCSGFCLETQHYPDSPNHPAFPSTRLNPGETYRSTTIYRFGTRA